MKQTYHAHFLIKNILSALFICGCAATIAAQSSLKIKQNTHFVVANNTQITLKDVGLESSGNMNTGQSNIIFSGNENAYLAGAVPIAFDRITLQKKIGKSLILKTDIAIKNKLAFQSGMVELQGKNINLNETGKLEGENEQNHIVEQMPLDYSCHKEGGKVIARIFVKPNTPVNPGNLGVVIFSPESLGTLVLRRGHTEQNLINAQCNGIFRYFDFTGDAAQNKNMTLRMYYLDDELAPDAEEKKLSLWQNNGKWAFQSIDARNTQDNFIEKKTLLPDVNVRWTVSPLTALPTATHDEQTTQLKIFPNPTYDFLNVELADWQTQNVRAILTDVSGKMIWQQKITANNGNLHLNFGHIAAGLYQLRMVTQAQTYVRTVSFLGN